MTTADRPDPSLMFRARCLAEAERDGDDEAAARYATKPAAIKRWRRELQENDDLRDAFVIEATRVRAAWRPEMSSAVVALARELKRRIRDDPGSIDSGELIAAFARLSEHCIEDEVLNPHHYPPIVVEPRPDPRPAPQLSRGASW